MGHHYISDDVAVYTERYKTIIKSLLASPLRGASRALGSGSDASALASADFEASGDMSRREEVCGESLSGAGCEWERWWRRDMMEDSLPACLVRVLDLSRCGRQ